jgi:hypothetical protein
MNKSVLIHEALQTFAAAVTAKMTQLTAGEPEDQVRGPFENFMAGVVAALGWNVVCTGSPDTSNSKRPASAQTPGISRAAIVTSLSASRPFRISSIPMATNGRFIATANW